MRSESVCVHHYYMLLSPTRFGPFCPIVREKSYARGNICTALLYNITRNGCSCGANRVPDYINTV